MGTLHKLIRTHGRDTARSLITPDDIPFFAIAEQALTDDSNDVSITYSGLAMAAMPHRRLPDDQAWVRSNGAVSLLIEPGRRPTTSRPLTTKDYAPVGVPYGAKARLILIYLQTEALRRNSPVIPLGRSMHDWLARMDISPGGKTYDEIRRQLDRICRCRLTISYSGRIDGHAATGHSNDAIVRHAVELSAPDDQQGRLWEDHLELSETYFRTLQEHPVPLWESAIRAIAAKSMAIDIYVWLAYRLRSLTSTINVSWPALFQQFGTPTADPTNAARKIRDFKPEFRTALKYALAVYEEARVEEADDGRGLILHPSRPPIPERTAPKLL